MCNTNMSVSTDGAVSTSQIPASEQETLVGIFVSSVMLENNICSDHSINLEYRIEGFYVKVYVFNFNTTFSGLIA